MEFFDKLFKKNDPASTVKEIDKAGVPVYPMIKSAEWQGINFVSSLPFVSINGQPDLAIVFAQDAGDRFEYLTKADLQKPGVPENFSRWNENISEYPYEIVIPKSLDNRIITASGEDHSSEKILSASFLTEACQALKTDRLVISIPRRRCLLITSFYEDFNMLETFFRLHFEAWREETYGNEPITEMVFLANKDKVEYAVPLGFRINLYEKNGQLVLSYSTMEELFDESDQISFQKIMEQNKIAVSL